MAVKNIILLLTGEIATGKSSLAGQLRDKYGFAHVETRKVLQLKAEGNFTEEKLQKRGFLQEYGNKLDKQTNGEWVVNETQEILNSSRLTVIDSIRIQPQIDAFRRRFHPNSVFHIHLTAPDDVKLTRFMERKKDEELTLDQKKAKYDEYKADETERNVPNLLADADLVVQTERQSRGDILTHVASFLKLRAPILNRNVDIVIGGQFGSEGKGQIAGYLAPEYDCLIRVGGPNAGHKVYQEPNPHTFHLIPSGSHRNKGAKIVIGPGAVISESKIIEEITHFNVEDRIIIDPNATIITDQDIKEEEKLDGIGSTKKGVGAATANNLFIHRLLGEVGHKAKHSTYLKPYIGDAHEIYDRVLSSSGKILLEGTQGTMLDLHHGFYPFVTSRPTTASGCLAEAGIGPGRVDKTIVVFRRYPIRVESPDNGRETSGPFSLEDVDAVPDITWKDVADRSGIPVEELQANELTTSTKRKRRVAEFNWALLRKSCEINTATDIAFSFADYIDVKNRSARQYDQLTDETRRFIEEMEQCAGVPVSLVATNFDFRAIVDRRKW